MTDRPLTQLQQDALRIVRGRTKLRPVTGKEIAATIGLKPRRSGKEGADMRSIIHALRRRGFPICATGAGYWWPRTKEELDVYLESFAARIAQQTEALASMQFQQMDAVEEVAVPEVVMKNEHWQAFVDGEIKVFTIPGNRVEVFLKKYPDGKRL